MIDTVIFGSEAFRLGFLSNVSVCIVELDEAFPPWQRSDTKSGTPRKKQDSQLTTATLPNRRFGFLADSDAKYRVYCSSRLKTRTTPVFLEGCSQHNTSCSLSPLVEVL